jgi:hypothetical protein
MAASVDYGYGGDAPDYGYGDADYGYGDDAKPAQPDYGYADDPKPPSDDAYGYGDAKPDEPTAQEDRRPKRRCSVTRYSIAPQSAPLNAAAVINDLRNGAAIETLGISEQAPVDGFDEKIKVKGGGGGRFKAMFRRGK